MTLTLAAAVSRYGADAKGKLVDPSAAGEPEDHQWAFLVKNLGMKLPMK